MFRATPIYERVPLVWVLVGLLFSSSGLYLGFDFSLSFLYMIVGMFCFAFGIALFVFRLRERPRGSEKTRLSPDFISAGDTQLLSASNDEQVQEQEQEQEQVPAQSATE